MKTTDEIALAILPCHCDLGSDRGSDFHSGACPAAYRRHVATAIAKDRASALAAFKRLRDQTASLRSQRGELAAALREIGELFPLGNQNGIDHEGIAREAVRRVQIARTALSKGTP